MKPVSFPHFHRPDDDASALRGGASGRAVEMPAGGQLGDNADVAPNLPTALGKLTPPSPTQEVPANLDEPTPHPLAFRKGIRSWFGDCDNRHGLRGRYPDSSAKPWSNHTMHPANLRGTRVRIEAWPANPVTQPN